MRPQVQLLEEMYVRERAILKSEGGRLSHALARDGLNLLGAFFEASSFDFTTCQGNESGKSNSFQSAPRSDKRVCID